MQQIVYPIIYDECW